MGTRGLLLRVAVSCMSLVAIAAAQDPVPLYPENYKVLVENDGVRVLDFRVRAGATEKSQSLACCGTTCISR